MSGPAVGSAPPWRAAALAVVLAGAGISIATNSGLAASSGDAAGMGRLGTSLVSGQSTAPLAWGMPM